MTWEGAAMVPGAQNPSKINPKMMKKQGPKIYRKNESEFIYLVVRFLFLHIPNQP